MRWTCDCCGWENPANIDDLPARHKIPCVRCGRPRGSRAETIAELEETIEDLEHDEKSSWSRANNLQDYISSLESEISELSLELNDVLSEITETRSELKIARELLAALQAYEPGTRQIAEDQRTLEVKA